MVLNANENPGVKMRLQWSRTWEGPEIWPKSFASRAAIQCFLRFNGAGPGKARKLGVSDSKHHVNPPAKLQWSRTWEGPEIISRGQGAERRLVHLGRFNGAGPGKARKYPCIRERRERCQIACFNGAGPGKARKFDWRCPRFNDHLEPDLLQWSRTWEGPEMHEG